MAKRKRKGASFGLRWSFLKESFNLGLKCMLTGKLPRPKRKKAKPQRKVKKRVPVDASKGRKRIA